MKLGNLLLNLGVDFINLFSLVKIFSVLGRRIYISIDCFERENFTASFNEIG